jgi:hypothetical protein
MGAFDWTPVWSSPIASPLVELTTLLRHTLNCQSMNIKVRTHAQETI